MSFYRSLKGMRMEKLKHTPKRRGVLKPYVPRGVKETGAPQVNLRVRPKNPLPVRDKKRWDKFKQQLLDRYDTNEYVRREELTASQHGSEYGKIGTEGFRQYTTVKGIPYRRNKPSHHKREKKVRQYAEQNEFPQSIMVLHSADQDVFRNKRVVYSMKKKQPVTSNVGNEGVQH